MALYSYGLCSYGRPGAAEEDERRVVEVGQHVDRAALAAQRDLAEQAFFYFEKRTCRGTPTGDRPRMHVDAGRVRRRCISPVFDATPPIRSSPSAFGMRPRKLLKQK